MKSYFDLITDKIYNFSYKVDEALIKIENKIENKIETLFPSTSSKNICINNIAPHESIIDILILECENDKLYLEGTNNINNTINNYLGINIKINLWCEWLLENKPKKVFCIINAQDGFDEDKYLIYMMYLFGINAIRGATFTDPKLSGSEISIIQKMITRYEFKYNYKCSQISKHKLINEKIIDKPINKTNECNDDIKIIQLESFLEDNDETNILKEFDNFIIEPRNNNFNDLSKDQDKNEKEIINKSCIDNFTSSSGIDRSPQPTLLNNESVIDNYYSISNIDNGELNIQSAPSQEQNIDNQMTNNNQQLNKSWLFFI